MVLFRFILHAQELARWAPWQGISFTEALELDPPLRLARPPGRFAKPGRAILRNSPRGPGQEGVTGTTRPARLVSQRLHGAAAAPTQRQQPTAQQQPRHLSLRPTSPHARAARAAPAAQPDTLAAMEAGLVSVPHIDPQLRSQHLIPGMVYHGRTPGRRARGERWTMQGEAVPLRSRRCPPSWRPLPSRCSR